MATHGLPLVWGATAREAERHYPADDAVPGPSVAMTRAIDVAAPVETTWRWLCQLSEAPYSYDWIDNLGRRSPRTLTPGAERVELGCGRAARAPGYDPVMIVESVIVESHAHCSRGKGVQHVAPQRAQASPPSKVLQRSGASRM